MNVADAAPRTLLVEDDPDDALLFRDLFEEIWPQGPEAEWARSFDEGLRLCQEGRFDVHLFDFRLGAKTGLELLAAVRERGCRAPVILLTGRGDRRVDKEASRAGAADFLPKAALTPDLLERSIRYAIANHAAWSALAETQRRLADSLEGERLSLARELHDGPMQDLIGVRYMISGLEGPEMEDSVVERLAMARSGLDKVARTLRALCGDLRPPSLTPFGLASSIRSHAERVVEPHGDLQLHLALDEDGISLPEDMRLALFRIYQHAISNVLRHAEAEHLSIRLRLLPEQVELEVEDDGRGFEPPKTWLEFGRQGHYGFLGADERSLALNGKLTVRSKPGEGTLLRVTAPRAVAPEREPEG